MGKLLHNLMSTLSRRYRMAHCRHVDELPPHMSQKLREECKEMCPKSYDTFDNMMADFEREWADEDSTAAIPGTGRKAAAVFA